MANTKQHAPMSGTTKVWRAEVGSSTRFKSLKLVFNYLKPKPTTFILIFQYARYILGCQLEVPGTLMLWWQMLSLIRFYASPAPLFDQDTILPCPGASGHHVPRVDHQNMWQHQTLLVTSAWSQRERITLRWNWMKQVWFCVTVHFMPAFHGYYCSFRRICPFLDYLLGIIHPKWLYMKCVSWFSGHSWNQKCKNNR